MKRINNIDATYIDKRIQGYSAVCVIRTNHPSELYKYFRVPTSVAKPAIATTTATTVAVNQTYKVGDALVSAKLSTIDGALAYRRVDGFQLPTATSSGTCSPIGRSIGFLTPLQGLTCTLNGAQMCALFPTTAYTNLFVQSVLWHNSSSPSFVPVDVTIVNASGYVLGTIDPSITPVSGTYVAYADSTTCHNAVVAVVTQYTYASNASGTIVAAAINVTVADVELTRYAALRFEVGFAAENVTLPENVIAGTPGYLPGLKVRAGTNVTNGDKSAILEHESGFAVPSGGRMCSENQWKRSSFLYSVRNSGCLLSMSESDLQQICSTGTGQIIAGLINTTVDGLGVAINRIAVTNDALTNDTSSWIAIAGLTEAFTLVPGTYNTYNRACENIMVGLHYQFVVARAGAEHNPQDIIVGAFASPLYGTLRIRNQTSFDGSATSLQQLSFKVTFSRYNANSQATIRRRVVAPPILPRLDSTIFYPFRSPYPL